MDEFVAFLLSILVNTPKKFIALLVALGLMAIGIVLFYGGGASEPQIKSYIAIGIAMLGTGAGIIALLIVKRFQESTRDWQLSKCAPEAAHEVIQHLRQTNELTHKNGPLVMANWQGVDLHDADLHDANLRQIGLEAAKLQHANLRHANLRSARLDKADLSQSNLSGATLCYARLQGANLRDTVLVGADLSAADMCDAQLTGADMCDAHFDKFTTLPDGNKWTPEADWSRFGAKPG